MRRGLALLLVLGGLFVPTIQAKPQQAAGRTVLDGVYSEAQATRGLALFTASCGACHGVDLAGVSAPPLKGDRFLERWREDTLDALFNFLVAAMPPAQARSGQRLISDSAFVDILAFMLKGNDYRPGSTELTVDKLGTVLLVGKDGPKPVPDGAPILTVGCLAQSREGAWVLFNATEPVRSRKPDETNPQELNASSLRPPGSLIFRLADLEAIPDFVPDMHKGHKMQAKGYLVRQPNAERVSLISLEMVKSTCSE